MMGRFDGKCAAMLMSLPLPFSTKRLKQLKLLNESKKLWVADQQVVVPLTMYALHAYDKKNPTP